MPPGEAPRPLDQEALLRRGFEEGRAAYGPLALGFEEFARAATDLALRRLRRLGAPRAEERATEALAASCLPDLFLARACEEGVPGAWEAFTARFGGKVLALALRRHASRAEAEEISRDLPGELFTPPAAGGSRTRLGTYDGAGSLTGWLAVIVHRRLVDRVRAATAAPPPPRPAQEPPDPAGEAEDAETCARFAEALRAALADLGPRAALAVRLKYGDGLSQAAIARVLGVGEPRVSRILAGAEETLRAAVRRRVAASPGGPGWGGLAGTAAREVATIPGEADPSGGRGSGHGRPGSGPA